MFDSFWEKECEKIIEELQDYVNEQNMTVEEVREYNLSDFGHVSVTFYAHSDYMLRERGRMTNTRVFCSDGIFYPKQYIPSNSYWDFWHYFGTLIAFIFSELVILSYVYKLIYRMKKLYRQMNAADYKKYYSSIYVEGTDEISILSEKIETMRTMLIQSLEEEKNQRERHTKLIASLSHDIRIPLTKIITCLDILNYELAKSEEERATCLSMITSKANQLKCLTDRLLNSVTHGEDELIYKREICDGPSMFGQLLFEGGYSLEEEGFKVHIPETISGRYRLKVDIVAIRRVADNVYSNIQKYADKEKPIEIWVEKYKKEATVCVQNYKKTETLSLEQESYGIGLKTIAQIMEALDGRSEVENQQDLFTIKLTLPLYE